MRRISEARFDLDIGRDRGSIVVAWLMREGTRCHTPGPEHTTALRIMRPPGHRIKRRPEVLLVLCHVNVRWPANEAWRGAGWMLLERVKYRRAQDESAWEGRQIPHATIIENDERLMDGRGTKQVKN